MGLGIGVVEERNTDLDLRVTRCDAARGKPKRKERKGKGEKEVTWRELVNGIDLRKTKPVKMEGSICNTHNSSIPFSLSQEAGKWKTLTL